jgi:hypothetical protein
MKTETSPIDLDNELPELSELPETALDQVNGGSVVKTLTVFIRDFVNPGKLINGIVRPPREILDPKLPPPRNPAPPTVPTK